MLFNVDKSTDYHQMKESLKKYGDLNFFSLKDDMKKKEYKFGQLDYHIVTDETALNDFLKSHNIQFKKKESKAKSSKQEFKQNREQKSFPKEKKSTYIANPSFYFYKDKAYGKDIEEFSLQNSYEELFSINGAQTFELTTIYPGLLVGSGYNHPKLKESQENKDDFQLGFFFDHTTGLPLISGSSIKGVLRSVFAHPEFIEDVYGKDVLNKLNYIFTEQKVIFYDAFIVKSANEDKKIFGSDYITSHYSDEPNGEFKEPNPIKFLKILPEVTFRFQFRFLEKDDEVYLELFKDIIKDFGLGAKTNTGYGKFIDHVEQNS